jgi:hypothetical protein
MRLGIINDPFCIYELFVGPSVELAFPPANHRGQRVGAGGQCHFHMATNVSGLPAMIPSYFPVQK